MTDPKEMYKRSSNHRALLRESELCGCFHCTTVFNVAAIEEWVDSDRTALCPHCGIDAVIPIPTPNDFLALLKCMHKTWFTDTSRENDDD